MTKRFWLHAALAISVAAIPALTAAAPVIVKALAPKHSRFEFAFQDASYDKLTAFVSNVGTRSGTVSAVVLTIQRPDKIDKQWLYTAYAEENAGIGERVQAGGRLLKTYVAAGDQLKAPTRKDRCALTFHATNFDSTEQTVIQPVDCARFELLTGAA